MNSKPVTVVAIVKARPGSEAALKQALVALIAPTRREAGCVNYDLHVDTEEPARFVFHEIWESKAHLDAHLDSPHLNQFESAAAPLLAEAPHIFILEKTG